MSRADVARWLEADDVSRSSSSNLPCRLSVTVKPKMRFKSGFPGDYYVNNLRDDKASRDKCPSTADDGKLMSISLRAKSKHGMNKMPMPTIVDLHSLD